MRRLSMVVVIALSASVVLAPQADARTKRETWHKTGTMKVARQWSTTTLLNDGRVLVTGGIDGSGQPVASAEIYNPKSEKWKLTGSMSNPRAYHTATVLPGGKVLIVGGNTAVPPATAAETDTAELYDPVTGTFSDTDSMSAKRTLHTAVKLQNGEVLVAGGQVEQAPGPAQFIFSDTAEIYDPTLATWSNAASMHVARYQHTATVLVSGNVLVTGGLSGSTPLNECELYDPVTDTWTVTGAMGSPRWVHSAARLGSGKILVVGGRTNYNTTTALDTGEVFDPMLQTWSNAANTMSEGRLFTSATILPNSKLLIAAGERSDFTFENSADIFDPTTATFTPTRHLKVGRFAPGAVGISMNGKPRILVAGGWGIAESEFYVPPA